MRLAHCRTEAQLHSLVLQSGTEGLRRAGILTVVCTVGIHLILIIIIVVTIAGVDGLAVDEVSKIVGSTVIVC